MYISLFRKFAIECLKTFHRLDEIRKWYNVAEHGSRYSTYAIQKVSEYDQDIKQSHTADQTIAPRVRATEH